MTIYLRRAKPQRYIRNCTDSILRLPCALLFAISSLVIVYDEGHEETHLSKRSKICASRRFPSWRTYLCQFLYCTNCNNVG